MTIDRNDPKLKEIYESGPLKGQQKTYLVLSDEEIAKGFLLPVCQTYRHLSCGTTTTMGRAIAETYAANPFFYGGTFCVNCGQHYPLRDASGHNFVWVSSHALLDGVAVGDLPDGYLIEEINGKKQLVKQTK